MELRYNKKGELRPPKESIMVIPANAKEGKLVRTVLRALNISYYGAAENEKTNKEFSSAMSKAAVAIREGIIKNK